MIQSQRELINAYTDLRNNENQNMVVEAFKAGDMGKVADLIAKSLGKQTGHKMLRLPGGELFSSSKGKGKGIRYIIDGTTEAVRFNFDNKNNITSVDIWGNDGSSHPQVHVQTLNVSIAKIIPFVADQINSPKMGKYFINIETGEIAKDKEDLFESMCIDLVEARGSIEVNGIIYKSKKAAAFELYNQGYDKKNVQSELGVSGVFINSIWKEFQNVAEVEVTKGATEVVVDPEEKEAQAAFTKQKFANPEEIFEDLEVLVGMVVKNIQPSLIVTGMAGIGKTYSITQILEKSGLAKNSGYIHIKGSASAAGLYRTLFQNRQDGKIVVFDDSDNVFKDPQAVNILKGALDSDEPREVSWVSANAFNAIGMTDEEIQSEYDAEEGKKFPNQFQVQCNIIFISNLPKAKFNKALLSRSFAIDITLKAEDVLLRMRSILGKIMPGENIDEKNEVMDYLEKDGKYISSADNPMNIRTLQKSIKLKSTGASNWEQLIARYSS